MNSPVEDRAGADKRKRAENRRQRLSAWLQEALRAEDEALSQGHKQLASVYRSHVVRCQMDLEELASRERAAGCCVVEQR